LPLLTRRLLEVFCLERA